MSFAWLRMLSDLNEEDGIARSRAGMEEVIGIVVVAVAIVVVVAIVLGCDTLRVRAPS